MGTKLKKAEFDRENRFRGARREGLVTCASCVHLSDKGEDNGIASCQHPERLRRIKIARYRWGFPRGKGDYEDTSSERVCDAHISQPLPDGVVVPDIPRESAVLLGTQHSDVYHATSECPYVVEELRIIQGRKTVKGRVGEVRVADLSEIVSGEGIGGDICEMPCCEVNLPFRVSQCGGSVDYRRREGLKPDGTEPIVWVRNAVVRHDKKSAMTFEEAEIFLKVLP